MTQRELTAGVAALLTFGAVFATGLLVGRFGWPEPAPPVTPCSVAERQTAYNHGYADAVHDDHVDTGPVRRATLADVARDWHMDGILRCYLEGSGDHRAWWLEEDGVLRDLEPQRP